MYSIKSKGLQFNYPYRLTFNLISQNNSHKEINTVNNYERPTKGSKNKEKPNTYIVKLLKDREQTIKENQKKKVDLLIDKALSDYENEVTYIPRDKYVEQALQSNRESSILDLIDELKNELNKNGKGEL